MIFTLGVVLCVVAVMIGTALGRRDGGFNGYDMLGMRILVIGMICVLSSLIIWAWRNLP